MSIYENNKMRHVCSYFHKWKSKKRGISEKNKDNKV